MTPDGPTSPGTAGTASQVAGPGVDRFAPSTPEADWFRFERLHTDASTPDLDAAGMGRVAARRGRLTLPHGVIETPCFMPVGTRGTVKGVTVDQLRTVGATIILGNTYHLTLRPGEEVVAALGGLHRFSGWTGPILTDSGGFQIFSLGDAVKVTESGAKFRSHVDGTLIDLTPERAVAIQEALGSDIAMVLDHVVGLPATEAVVRDAHERSLRWAERCQKAHTRRDQTQFAIVQGGLDADLRRESALALTAMDFRGYAVGGLSVGEAPEEMYRGIEQATPHLPVEKPRYLMGVGRPEDLLEAIRRGVDMFDCVMPTRNGRNAFAFTRFGRIKMRHATHLTDTAPLDAECPCIACRHHSRGYLRHLFLTDEMLGPILLTIHNLTYYLRLMQEAREAIEADQFAAFHERCRRDWAIGAAAT